MKKSEVNEAKWSGIRWSEVQYREGGERVFVEKVYRIVTDEKWRAGVKAWVKIIKKKQLQETVHSTLLLGCF